MKSIKKKIIVSTACLLFSFGAFTQKKDGYKIIGTIHQVPDGTEFYLIKKGNLGFDTVQRTAAVNEKFAFSGHLELEGEVHFIKMNTSVVKINSKRTWVTLMLNHSNITITGALKKWPEVQINSKETNLLNTINARALQFDTLINKVSWKDTIAKDIAKKAYRSFLDSICQKNPDSYAIASVLYFFKRGLFSEKDQQKLFDSFTQKVKDGYYGNWWKQENYNSGLRKSIKENEVIPDFKFKNKEGKLVNVRDVISKSKYTLIDFWASWCKPCKEELPFLKAAYNKYHIKGFNIIGIALKDKDTAWQRAMKEADSPWLHGIEHNGELWNLFGLGSLPAYILVDQQGKLLVFSSGAAEVPRFGGTIREQDLEKKLSALFNNEK